MSKKPKSPSKPKPSRIAREEAGGKNQDGFTLPPRSCYVIGVDTEDGPEHPLYSQRAVDLAAGRLEYDMRMLRSLHTYGVKQAILVRLHTVPVGDQQWPEELHGHTVHVVVAGRHRVLYGRRVAREKCASGEIGHLDNWQIKCSLELAKAERDLVSIMVDENVCRRVLGDDEIAESILKGISVSLTLEEMADRYGIKVSKAKRLLARAQGVPEKPKATRPARISAATLARAEERLRGSVQLWDGADVAAVIEVIRGKRSVASAPGHVRDLFADLVEED